MVITGLQRRSIAQQTGSVHFDFSAISPNTSGTHSFGLSGASGAFKFILSGGKVFDPNGSFAASYFPNSSVQISGVVSPASFNYTVDGELIAFGQPTPSSLYSSPISHLFAESVSNLELSSFIKGESADYSLEASSAYTYINPLVSGKIINNNSGRSFRIFDAYLNGDSSYSISSFTTGNITTTGYIVFSGDGLGKRDEILPVTLQTNFGQVDYNFVISGDYTLTPDVYLNLSPDSTVAFSDRPLFLNLVASNYPSGSRIGVSLEYLSGTTGNIYYYSGQTGFATAAMSGYITGCDSLRYQVTGRVSGLDPKTAIWETGVGTGQFASASQCATGNVSGDYSINLYGLGNGTLTLDYTASGYTSGYFHGRIPFTGAYLNATAYNYTGTGYSPVVSSALVPTGNGKIYARQTGCVSILEPISGTDYYSANLSVPKVYSGPISYNYSVLGVGFATGRTFSGVVTSSFVPDFEQGSYYFNKYFSGVLSGNSIISTGIFEITGCPSSANASGVITGTFSASYPLLCSDTEEFPRIRVSGYPIAVYNSDGSLADPNTVYTFRPSGGFDAYDDSLDNYLDSGVTKTKISRMGATSSGVGTFLNPVNDCAIVPREVSSTDFLSHYWREQISGTDSYRAFDSLDNGIGIVNTKLYITGTGDFAVDPVGAKDSGVMEFYISGSGYKAIALKGLNKGTEDRILNLTLYKNGILSDSWENLYVQSNLYDKYGEAAYNTSVYDTMVISELGSGKYSLVVTAKPVALPQVSFWTDVFSGCESSNAIRIVVRAEGVFRKGCCVKMTQYDEITAHSGVHYDPIYLDYSNTGLVSSGCQPVGAHTPRGMSCPGICFEASVPDAYGRWESEIKDYYFTIPIYDNAVYGDPAEFLIYLDVASASGCEVSSSTATVRIIDNDNKQFTTVTGNMPDISSLDCSLVPDEPPPPPDPCTLNPAICDPCVADPTLCDPEPPCNCANVKVPCLPCANTQPVTGLCNGTFVSGNVGTPGLNCGAVSMTGCGPTTDYVYVGQMPSSGSYPRYNFTGNCLEADVLMFPSNCGQISPILCTGNTGECPQTITWSGCVESPAGIYDCSGNSSPVIHVGRTVCTNYADPTTYGNSVTVCALDVFLKVSSVSCSSSSVGCHNWGFTGYSAFPLGNPQTMLCDAFYD